MGLGAIMIGLYFAFIPFLFFVFALGVLFAIG